MMSTAILLLGVILAFAIIAAAVRLADPIVRIVAVALAVVVLVASFTLASFRYVGEDKVGVVVKNIGFSALPPGKIIATQGEKGPQARTLPPGWQPWFWPFIYDIDFESITDIPAGKVGLLTASDGKPLPADTTYAPEWPAGSEKNMAQDAEYFLTKGGGCRGPQTSVLKPGKHRINPTLFTVKLVPITTVEKAKVGVVKSNVGERVASTGGRTLVDRGQRGIWREPLLEGQYYLNTDAYEVTIISTENKIVHYTKSAAKDGAVEEREIIVRTSDGFTFPVDVRIEYQIRPSDASLIVASVGDDQVGLRTVMNSAVRGIFRDNAEGVKALDYVQQRSLQEKQSTEMLQEQMSKIGVTIVAVRIGDVGDAESLGPLLQTQTDREIALQEQETFREQQRAAEQKKQLTRTQQEAEEEKRLATAKYAVQIAEQTKEKRIIEAGAAAEAIRIEAEAQAKAYQKIAEQIGKGNAALVEILKIVGEGGISITPRVMVSGASGSTGAETTALIGTMLDSMMQKEIPDGTPQPPSATPRAVRKTPAASQSR